MLDINLGLLLFVAVLFLALVYILDKMLYRPLLTFMDQRDETIAKDLATTKALGSEAEEALQQAHDTIAKAKAEAMEIRETAREKAKTKAASMVAAVEEEIQVQYETFTQKLAEERSALKQSIEANLPKYQDAIQNKLKQIS